MHPESDPCSRIPTIYECTDDSGPVRPHQGRKKRGTLADLKRGSTVSVKATGIGIVLHKNNGGGSEICINAQKVWVLPEDTGD